MIAESGNIGGTAARRAYELLRTGTAEYEIVRLLMQDYALVPAQAEEAIGSAYDFLRQRHGLRSEEDKRNLSIAQLQQLAVASIERGKLHIALHAFNARDRLLGFHQTKEKEKPGLPQTLLELIQLEQQENAARSALEQKQTSEAGQNDGNPTEIAGRSDAVLPIGSGGAAVGEAM